MTCVRHGGNEGSIFCRYCDLETIEREEAMTLQERLRFELCRIADEECYDGGSHQLMFLRQSEARELRDALDAQERALAEIREVWAGSECGEPVYAQEAYAIRLCKQMYQIACDALSGKAPVAPDEVNRLSVRCESQRLKIDAQEARIKRLEEALRKCILAIEDECNADGEDHPMIKRHKTVAQRARAALEGK